MNGSTQAAEPRYDTSGITPSHAPIRDDAWRPIDEAIFANLKLQAIQQIRALTGSGISEAVFVLSDRYKKLRAESPERFTCPDEEYCNG